LRRDDSDPDPDPIIPASIRSNNPGGMWPGKSAARFGSTSYEQLNDPDRNRIAQFDSPVLGAAAQFDLLASKHYLGRPIGQIIDDWSGSTGGKGNVSDYATQVAGSIGLKPSDPLTLDLLNGPTGIALAKTQAAWEAGTDYPMTDQQWQTAQRLALTKGSQTQPLDSPDPMAAAAAPVLASAEDFKRKLGLMN